MKHKKAESILAWIFTDYLQFYITDSRCFNSIISPLEQLIKFLPMTLKSLWSTIIQLKNFQIFTFLEYFSHEISFFLWEGSLVMRES